MTSTNPRKRTPTAPRRRSAQVFAGVGLHRPYRRRVALLAKKRPVFREHSQAHAFDEEVQKVRELASQLSVRLERSQEKLDSSLHQVDRVLEELAEQRERIGTLERDLGIER